MTRQYILMAVFNEIDYDGRVQRSAEALGAHHDVTVVSIDSGRGYQNPAFNSQAISLSAIRWRPLQLLVFWFRLILIATRFSPDLIYAHDFNVILPCWLAALLARTQWAYDAHELIIPEPEPAPQRPPRYWYWCERFCIRRANLVIAANRERGEIMQRHYQLQEFPLVVQNIPPPPADTASRVDLFTSYPQLIRTSSRSVWLVYEGVMNPARGVCEVITALRYLDERFQLLLVGDDRQHMSILHGITRHAGVGDRVVHLGTVPRDHLHAILSFCDIGIAPYPSRGMNNIYCASNKLFEYLQAGLPVVTTCQPPLRALIEEHRIGVVVGCKPSTPDHLAREFAAAISRVADNRTVFTSGIPDCLQQNPWAEEEQKLLRAVANL